MKTQLKNQTFDMHQLNPDELLSINGGGFWKDLFYTIGATAKSIWTFSKTASEFQHSLPPNLKK